MSWQQSADQYQQLIRDPEWDSKILREIGLIPTTLEFIGQCDDSTFLDAGTGNGWIFDHVHPKEAHACDIVQPERVPAGVDFKQMDVHRLSYPDQKFDVIVASLLLMFCKDAEQVCRELFRVGKAMGGRMVVSLVHPYFYRTGTVIEQNSFLITRDLSQACEIEVHIGDRVGPFVYYYRPFPYYINALTGAGWRLVHVHDWFLDMERYNRHLAHGVRRNVVRSGAVPLYSFIECRR